VAGRGGDPGRVVEQQQHHGPDGQHDEQRRQQAQGAPGVEEPQRSAPVHPVLVQQHRGDQEAGQDEEDVEPDPAAGEQVR